MKTITKNHHWLGTLLALTIAWTGFNAFSQTEILQIDPTSFTGSIAPPPDAFVTTQLASLTCQSAEVTFLGTEIDAGSSSGSIIIGLYENTTLIYQTNPLAVTGGVDELVGEVVPAGIVMDPGVTYRIGVITTSSGNIEFKTTNAPVHQGITTYGSGSSFFNTSTTYPTLPDPWAITGAWGFNVVFNISGTVSSANTTASIAVTTCDAYISPSGNFIWTTSGTYNDTIANSAGCDSLITVDLTLTNSTTSSETVTACDSYNWNGSTYTSSGIYTWVGTNAANCDSTATLDLTITNSTTSSETVTACDSYDWNGSTYTTSGIYTWVGTNAANCDSTATLDLTITSSTTSFETATACGSYDWNGSTYTTSGIYTWVGTNAANCDSMVTLDLTINTIDLGVSANDLELTADAVGAAYQWIDCSDNAPIAGATNRSFTATQNGDYAVIVDNTNCSDTSVCVTISSVGIDAHVADAINVYPNPSNGQFTVDFDGELKALNVLDMTGRKIPVVVNLASGEINAEKLLPGKYLVQIETETQDVIMTEIIIQ